MKKLVSALIFATVLGYVSLANFLLIQKGITSGNNNVELVRIAYNQILDWRAPNQAALAHETTK
jgi:hypothetical protein